MPTLIYATSPSSLVQQVCKSATGRSFGFAPASVLLRAALHDATSLQRLLLHYKHSRLDRANGPELWERPPSRLGSSLMQCAGGATGGECSRA